MTQTAGGMTKRDRHHEQERAMTYHIISQAGADYGIWEGESPAHALASMHRDAGYQAVTVGPSGAIIWPDGQTLELCGDTDVWTIMET